jgi:GTP-binding protein HflX
VEPGASNGTWTKLVVGHRHFPCYGSGVTVSLEPTRPRTVLVGVHLPSVSEADFQASLAELARLVDTLGFDVIAQITQRRARLSPSAALGTGKLKELAQLTGGSGIVESGAKKRDQRKDLNKAGFEAVELEDEDEDDEDEGDAGDEADAPRKAKPLERATVVVVDNDISPSQLRNLEKATGVEVLDRAGVIIEIFWRHARTKEAQMQVEIARLQYETPRLREKENTGDRQRGGSSGGKGDLDLEYDRRRIRDRISELKEKLAEIEADANTRRQRRKDAMRVALVGYTNAGKSSLMRALSGSDVLVADKLFATLGTTVRTVPDTTPKVLVSDTVGFIKDLPHSLVASFKSTLDEAHEASLLLFVVDAADPAFPGQLAVTKTVLKEIEADDIPSLLILNKIDRVSDDERGRLRREYPHAVQMSALDPSDVKALKARLVQHFDDTLEEVLIGVPHAKVGAALAYVHENMKLISEAWDGWGARLKVKGMPEGLAHLKSLAGTEVAPPLDDGSAEA